MKYFIAPSALLARVAARAGQHVDARSTSSRCRGRWSRGRSPAPASSCRRWRTAAARRTRRTRSGARAWNAGASSAVSAAPTRKMQLKTMPKRSSASMPCEGRVAERRVAPLAMTSSTSATASDASVSGMQSTRACGPCRTPRAAAGRSRRPSRMRSAARARRLRGVEVHVRTSAAADGAVAPAAASARAGAPAAPASRPSAPTTLGVVAVERRRRRAWSKSSR